MKRTCRATQGQEAKNTAPGASPSGAGYRDRVRNENPQTTVSEVAASVRCPCGQTTLEECAWRPSRHCGLWDAE
jgi:hypothetical protein